MLINVLNLLLLHFYYQINQLIVTCELKYQLMSYSIWAMREMRDTLKDTNESWEIGYLKWSMPKCIFFERSCEFCALFSLHFTALSSFRIGHILYWVVNYNKTVIRSKNISIYKTNPVIMMGKWRTAKSFWKWTFTWIIKNIK